MSIVNPSIVELSEKVDCRYTLVVEASKRARQLVQGSQPLIDAKEMKPLKVAVEEINRGLLNYARNPDLED
ncbi:MAG: DNA-directed RNA polymerase subunit omega [Candidatus Limiplasma sp.]|nr:DNA-directed RNA polymerase subunit omega [Candidatus Limiplasma sp.]MEA5145008.1 DNA-directed RNA polymerase subunit omega [Candidatus Limiplasma sp.]